MPGTRLVPRRAEGRTRVPGLTNKVVLMAIPSAAYPAPFNITRASHAVLTVKDMGASRAFYVDALGFAVSDEDANTLYLRGIEEACHHSLVLKRAKDSP